MERQLPEYGWFDIQVVAGVFTDKVSQRIAESLGMVTLYEFVYSAWTATNKTTGEQVEFFKEIVRENYSAKVMSVKIGRSSSVHSGTGQTWWTNTKLFCRFSRAFSLLYYNIQFINGHCVNSSGWPDDVSEKLKDIHTI